ncbi:unnamed protein product [Fraxinus pennsylvanica]|uniref:60S acidic ribosomal protein P1 n=1 Tax=Fraxinus pennsylvanica TaxID=56036 RepID=A0AAD1Z444_9LAMI|nr:unnamed protein product [Fraxinus pennsylvanica]
MSCGEIACTYACLILHDDGIPITAEKIATLVKAANVKVESYWPSLFAKLCEKRNVEDLVTNVGAGGGGAAVAVAAPAGGAGAAAEAAPAAEEKKEEPKEESDDDMGFESLGQKVALSWAPSSNMEVQRQGVSKKFDEVKKGKEISDSSQPPSQAKKTEVRLPARRPRFAPEFDGVHCFETIIPY